MEEYKIIMTSLANSDIDKIRWYIQNIIQEPKIAEKVISKIKDAIRKLNKFPTIYYKTEMVDKYSIRRMVVDNYIIIYMTDEINKKNIILRVVYGKSNIDKLPLYEKNKKYYTK